MNRTTWLENRGMKKSRDVLSRWERRQHYENYADKGVIASRGAVTPVALEPLVEIGRDRGHQRLDLAVEEMVGAYVFAGGCRA